MNLPALRASLPVPRSGVPATRRRFLPTVRGSVALVAVGLAVEFVARAITQRVLTALSAVARPPAPVADAAERVTRTIVTEIVVRERFRRPR